MPRESFEKYWAPVAAIIGAVLLVINFFNALQGDKTVATFALIFVSLIAIIAGMWKYAFALSNKPFVKNGKYGFYPRYGYHLAAKISILLCVISIVVYLGYILTALEIVPDCCGIVPTSTQTSTLTPIPTQTDTLTPTIQPSATIEIPSATFTPIISTQSAAPNYFITDCIEYGVWNIWGMQDIFTPQPDDQNRRCYDLSKKSLTAQQKRLNSSIEGLRININTSQKTMNGIYFPLEKVFDLKLSLEIEQLTSAKKCKPNEVCDVNLIIGFGDPYHGWLLVFRNITEDSPIYTCSFETIDTACVGEKQIASTSGDGPIVHDLQFTRNGQDIEIIVDGKIIGNKSIFGMDERFWIGYQIRRHGTIKAFIQFK